MQQVNGVDFVMTTRLPTNLHNKETPRLNLYKKSFPFLIAFIADYFIGIGEQSRYIQQQIVSNFDVMVYSRDSPLHLGNNEF